MNTHYCLAVATLCLVLMPLPVTARDLSPDEQQVLEALRDGRPLPASPSVRWSRAGLAALGPAVVERIVLRQSTAGSGPHPEGLEYSMPGHLRRAAIGLDEMTWCAALLETMEPQSLQSGVDWSWVLDGMHYVAVARHLGAEVIPHLGDRQRPNAGPHGAILQQQRQELYDRLCQAMRRHPGLSHTGLRLWAARHGPDVVAQNWARECLRDGSAAIELRGRREWRVRDDVNPGILLTARDIVWLQACAADDMTVYNDFQQELEQAGRQDSVRSLALMSRLGQMQPEELDALLSHLDQQRLASWLTSASVVMTQRGLQDQAVPILARLAGQARVSVPDWIHVMASDHDVTTPRTSFHAVMRRAIEAYAAASNNLEMDWAWTVRCAAHERCLLPVIEYWSSERRDEEIPDTFFGGIVTLRNQMAQSSAFLATIGQSPRPERLIGILADSALVADCEQWSPLGVRKRGAQPFYLLRYLEEALRRVSPEGRAVVREQMAALPKTFGRDLLLALAADDPQEATMEWYAGHLAPLRDPQQHEQANQVRYILQLLCAQWDRMGIVTAQPSPQARLGMDAMVIDIGDQGITRHSGPQTLTAPFVDPSTVRPDETPSFLAARSISLTETHQFSVDNAHGLNGDQVATTAFGNMAKRPDINQLAACIRHLDRLIREADARGEWTSANNRFWYQRHWDYPCSLLSRAIHGYIDWNPQVSLGFKWPSYGIVLDLLRDPSTPPTGFNAGTRLHDDFNSTMRRRRRDQQRHIRILRDFIFGMRDHLDPHKDLHGIIPELRSMLHYNARVRQAVLQEYDAQAGQRPADTEFVRTVALARTLAALEESATAGTLQDDDPRLQAVAADFAVFRAREDLSLCWRLAYAHHLVAVQRRCEASLKRPVPLLDRAAINAIVDLMIEHEMPSHLPPHHGTITAVLELFDRPPYDADWQDRLSRLVSRMGQWPAMRRQPWGTLDFNQPRPHEEEHAALRAVLAAVIRTADPALLQQVYQLEDGALMRASGAWATMVRHRPPAEVARMFAERDHVIIREDSREVYDDHSTAVATILPLLADRDQRLALRAIVAVLRDPDQSSSDAPGRDQRIAALMADLAGHTFSSQVHAGTVLAMLLPERALREDLGEIIWGYAAANSLDDWPYQPFTEGRLHAHALLHSIEMAMDGGRAARLPELFLWRPDPIDGRQRAFVLSIMRAARTAVSDALERLDPAAARGMLDLILLLDRQMRERERQGRTISDALHGRYVYDNHADELAAATLAADAGPVLDAWYYQLPLRRRIGLRQRSKHELVLRWWRHAHPQADLRALLARIDREPSMRMMLSRGEDWWHAVAGTDIISRADLEDPAIQQAYAQVPLSAPARAALAQRHHALGLTDQALALMTEAIATTRVQRDRRRWQDLLTSWQAALSSPPQPERPASPSPPPGDTPQVSPPEQGVDDF